MNKSIRKDAKTALKKRKRSVSSIMFSFLAAACGIYVIRMNLVKGLSLYTVLIGAILSVVYFAVKACASYKMQAQMIMLLSSGKKPVITLREYAKGILLSAYLTALKSAELIAVEAVPISMIFLLFISIKSSAVSRAFCLVIIINAALLAIIGAVFFTFSVQKYAKALFLLAAYPSFSVSECVNLSIVSGENKTAELLRFKLGFAPWLLACSAIFPLLYFIPYYKQSLTCFFVKHNGLIRTRFVSE